MKKIILLAVIIFSFSYKMYSQENIENGIESSNNFNELKLNGFYLILGAFEVTYERTLTDESGLGISVFLPFDKEISDDIEYYISPYYRFYFGEKYAAGFFVEGFGMLNSTYRNFNEGMQTDFALGIGLGGKWLTKGGFIGELSFGFGRNLFVNSDDYYQFVGKGGITIGYRF